jgi:tRNA (cmo5U34)-methyltransferase
MATYVTCESRAVQRVGLGEGRERNAEKMRAAVEEHVSLLDPLEDENILRDAGFSEVSLFYAAFTWRGWVGYA